MRPNFAILTAAFCLCGCAGGPGDPSTRAGLWTPEHYNDTNLKAMVANPDDLQYGHGDNAAIGETAADAVTRLRAGKVRSLPVSGVLDVVPVSTGAPTSAGGGQ